MRKASFEDKEKIIQILHATFITETFPNSINFVLKKDGNRSDTMHQLMEYQVKMALRFGAIFFSDNEQSCILFLDPERKRMTLKRLLWSVQLVRRCIGYRNIFKVLKRETIIAKHHPKVPYLHLWLMGTAPKYKGKGIGTILLKEVLDYYGNSKPIYLETTTALNRNFYKKAGFRIFRETHMLEYPLYFLIKDAVD